VAQSYIIELFLHSKSCKAETLGISSRVVVLESTGHYQTYFSKWGSKRSTTFAHRNFQWPKIGRDKLLVMSACDCGHRKTAKKSIVK